MYVHEATELVKLTQIGKSGVYNAQCLTNDPENGILKTTGATNSLNHNKQSV